VEIVLWMILVFRAFLWVVAIALVVGVFMLGRYVFPAKKTKKKRKK
jgi:hypothetical protein